MLLRILLCSFLCLNFACGNNSSVNLGNIETPASVSTPIAEISVPSDWKQLEIGPIIAYVPADFENKNVRGIDSEVYEFSNEELSFGLEVGPYSEVAETCKFQCEISAVVVDGKTRNLVKSDLNKPATNSATNSDGSKSTPFQKYLLVQVSVPEESALLSVKYTDQSSTNLALAILQSVKFKKVTKE